MKPRYIFLAIGLVICASSIVLIMVKGNPQDKVSLDSVSEVGESILHHADAAGKVLTAVTDSEEMEIGDRIHSKIWAGVGKEFKDTPLEAYINEVGNALAQNVKRKGIKYKFHIVDGYYPNAFALPGGHVYVTTSLYAILGSEAELASVLGHEITHIDAKHCIGAIQHKIKMEKVLGADVDTYVDIGYQIFLRPGYSEYQESEADTGGVYLAYMAGYHPMAAVGAFERIRDFDQRAGPEDKSLTPVGDTLKAVGGMFGRYFDTHPPVQDRIDKVKKYIEGRKLLAGGRRFYIGQRNIREEKSARQARYKEELNREYAVPMEAKTEKREEKKEEKKEAPPKITEEKAEPALKEVYTGYGRVAVGMSVAEIEKILPEKSRAFKREDRMGYKSIMVYDFADKKGEATEAGLLFELEKEVVRGISIVK